MKAFWFELRHSAVLWVVLPVTVGWVWLSLSQSFMWLGSWPAATASGTAPVMYAAIATGATVAADAARRGGTAPRAALRLSGRAHTAALIHLGAGTLLATIPMAVALLVVTIRNAVLAPAGHPWVSYAIFGLATLVTAVSAAHLIGSAAPSIPIGGLAGAAVGFVVGAYANVPLAAPPNVQLSLERICIALAVALVVTVLAVLVPARLLTAQRERRHTGLRVTAVGAVLAVITAVVLAPMAGDLQVPRSAPLDPPCSDTAPRVCVWPEHAGYLPLLAPVAERVASAADGVLRVPADFLQEGLDDPSHGAAVFGWLAADDGLWFAAQGMADASLNTTFLARGCWPTNDRDWAARQELNAQLEYWLTARGYGALRPPAYQGTFDDTTSAKEALELDEKSQKDWARNIVRQIDDVPCAVGSDES